MLLLLLLLGCWRTIALLVSGRKLRGRFRQRLVDSAVGVLLPCFAAVLLPRCCRCAADLLLVCWSVAGLLLLCLPRIALASFRPPPPRLKTF